MKGTSQGKYAKKSFLTDLGTHFRICGWVMEIEGMMCCRNFSGGGIEGVLGI